MRHFIILTIILAIMGVSFLDAIDRSIYPGCKVLKQSGQTLIIRLDPELLDGTDSGCEAAERLISRIQRDGYEVKIAIKEGEWAPFPKLAVIKK